MTNDLYARVYITFMVAFAWGVVNVMSYTDVRDRWDKIQRNVSRFLIWFIPVAIAGLLFFTMKLP